ncbi:MAG: hypothetical protein DRQ88_00385 [Epsilonproteobacteria bacterium]|nr:MAG: hypothetical protein DRQ89_03465 [Campylobacterota bacterium]RLA68093.1 MAG: hypothetical protein DRQ88_00385 [Campylobacterota bacterium]
MFAIGEIKDKKLALNLGNHLTKKGVTNRVIFNPDKDNYLLLVLEEKDVPLAMDYYRSTLGIPKPIEIDPMWEKVQTLPMGRLTLTFIIISVFIFILSLIPGGKTYLNDLYFSNDKMAFMKEISQGQYWRLWTPIFLHFSFLHIIFNMLWLKDLGKLFENSKGPVLFFIFVLVTGLLSNFAQYLTLGPSFGGMSGVVFGLLGYVWMNKTFNPNSAFGMPKADVILMAIWFVLCTVGIIGNIANLAHAVGLSAGMTYGIYSGCKDYKWNLTKGFLFISLSLGITLVTFGVEYLKFGKKLYFFNFIG